MQRPEIPYGCVCFLSGSSQEATLMNYWILSAGILSLLTLLLHAFSGGPEIHVPILESELSVELKAIFSVIWHAITAVLGLSGAALLLTARRRTPPKALILFIFSQYLAFTALFVFYGLTRLESLLPMPQWTIFIVLTGLTLVGLRNVDESEATIKN